MVGQNKQDKHERQKKNIKKIKKLSEQNEMKRTWEKIKKVNVRNVTKCFLKYQSNELFSGLIYLRGKTCKMVADPLSGCLPRSLHLRRSLLQASEVSLSAFGLS